jgi:hypothetical protein
LPDVEYRLSLAWGGGDGIIRYDGDEGDVTAQDPPSMQVDVGTFRGYVSHRFSRQAASQETAEIDAPTGGAPGDLRRIDLVQWTLAAGVNVKTGVDSATPTAPDADADSHVLAHVYCRNAMTCIKDTDDGTNGYIVQAGVRTFI